MTIESFDTNFSKLSDGDFILKLRSLADAFEKHEAYQVEVPEWISGPRQLRECADELTKLVAAMDMGSDEKEAERLALRAKGERHVTFAGQYLVMFSTHHNDPTFLNNLGLGFKHRTYVKTPISPPDKPQKFVAKNGLETGSALLYLNRGQGSNGSIEIQITEDPSSENSWRSLGHFFECRIELKGLDPVKRYYFRARFHNASGAGPWSEVVMLVVI